MNTSEKIWNDYNSRLKSFIKSKVPEDAVEDILQDVFMKIHINIASLRESSRVESWIYRITRNSIIDYYRSRKTTKELPEWTAQETAEKEKPFRKELSSCLVSMINELPEKYRNAIQMSELENRALKEIAEKEGISLSGAKSRVQRGRKLLKSMLYECCRFELNRNNQIVSYEKKKDKNFC